MLPFLKTTQLYVLEGHTWDSLTSTIPIGFWPIERAITLRMYESKGLSFYNNWVETV